MPRRRRPENRDLPPRWQWHHGKIYYRVPPGCEDQWDGKRRFLLGRTVGEAYITWGQRVQTNEAIGTIAALLDRFAREEVPKRRPATQQSYLRAIGKLRPVFGAMAVTAVKPKHAYQYVERRGAKVAAKREVEVLSAALSAAVRWGVIDANPLLRQLRISTGSGRSRYVEDWEIEEVMRLKTRVKRGSVAMVQAYIRLKLLTGARRADLLALRTSDLLDEGVYIKPSKTAASSGKSAIFTWTPELRAAVDAALAARPVDISPFVFCTKRGESYIKADGSASGFDSIWRRFMDRALAETRLEKRFAERDLRAKVGSDAGSLEEARTLLIHSDAKTTARWYRRKPVRIKPQTKTKR